MKNIYIEIENGALTAIYGDRLDDEVRFVLRDMDNILHGDEDPLPESYEPEARYW